MSAARRALRRFAVRLWSWVFRSDDPEHLALALSELQLLRSDGSKGMRLTAEAMELFDSTGRVRMRVAIMSPAGDADFPAIMLTGPDPYGPCVMIQAPSTDGGWPRITLVGPGGEKVSIPDAPMEPRAPSPN